MTFINDLAESEKKDLKHDKTREKILQLLKVHGEMTVVALSSELKVSGVNIRGHLGRLERDGYVSMRSEKGPDRGRPSYLYKLTPKGHATFQPSINNDLAADVLKQVRQMFGAQAVQSIFSGRAHEFLAQLQERFRDKPLEVSRISELAELLRRLGYTVEVTAVGTSEYLLTIKHCPISNVAADFPEVCEAELQMQREALGAKVSLNRTIFQGGSNCHYRILFQQKP